MPQTTSNSITKHPNPIEPSTLSYDFSIVEMTFYLLLLALTLPPSHALTPVCLSPPYQVLDACGRWKEPAFLSWPHTSQQPGSHPNRRRWWEPASPSWPHTSQQPSLHPDSGRWLEPTSPSWPRTSQQPGSHPDQGNFIYYYYYYALNRF